MAATLISGLMVLVIVIGYIASGTLFIIGLIRLLLKKGWKILIISVVVFGAITIISFVFRIVFSIALAPSINQRLQEQAIPTVIDLNQTNASQSPTIILRTPTP